MINMTQLHEAKGNRGPRWFVEGTIHRGEYAYSYHADGDRADQAAERLRETGHHGVKVTPPIDLDPLAEMTLKLAKERRLAQAALSDATDKVRACVERLTASGVSEVQAADLAGVTRQTVRSWIGK